MARVELSPEAGDDLERILDHLVSTGSPDAAGRLGLLLEAISILESNPMIGRPAARDLRELVIGRAERGYVAPYRYVDAVDTVFVLAI